MARSDRSRCGTVRLLRSLAQPSQHLGAVRSLSLWSVAHFEIACAVLGTLGLSDRSHCRRGAHFAFWDRSHNSLGTLRVSDRSCCGAVPILMVKQILRRDLDQEVFCRELAQRSCHGDPLLEILYRKLLWAPCTDILPRSLLQRSCQQSSYREFVQRSCQETS